MEWKDSAIILHRGKYTDKLMVLTCFTSKYGLSRGAVSNTKKNQVFTDVGSVISVSWRGRLEEHLGKFSIVSHEAIYPFIYHDVSKMSALTNLCEIFRSCLAPKEPNSILYSYLEDFLYAMKYNESNWLQRLLFLEMEFLAHTGFGLDVSKCGVTGEKEDLCYISPKTGRAISKEVGLPYEEKLFSMTKAIQRIECESDTEDIINSLGITQYFLEKNFKIPGGRKKFIEVVRMLQKEQNNLESN